MDNVIETKHNEIRKQLGKDGVMAIDIVDYDQNTKGLRDFLSEELSGKIVC